MNTSENSSKKSDSNPALEFGEGHVSGAAQATARALVSQFSSPSGLMTNAPAFFLILSGAAGYWMVHQNTLWDSQTQQDSSAQTGNLLRESGGVRHKHEGSMIWKDLGSRRKPLSVQFGDSVFTDEKGQATLEFQTGARATLTPNSLVVISLPEEKSAADRAGSSWFSQVAEKVKSKIQASGNPSELKTSTPTLNVKQGNLKIEVSSAAAPVKIQVGKKVFEVSAPSAKHSASDPLKDVNTKDKNNTKAATASAPLTQSLEIAVRQEGSTPTIAFIATKESEGISVRLPSERVEKSKLIELKANEVVELKVPAKNLSEKSIPLTPQSLHTSTPSENAPLAAEEPEAQLVRRAINETDRRPAQALTEEQAERWVSRLPETHSAPKEPSGDALVSTPVEDATKPLPELKPETLPAAHPDLFSKEMQSEVAAPALTRQWAEEIPSVELPSETLGNQKKGVPPLKDPIQDSAIESIPQTPSPTTQSTENPVAQVQAPKATAENSNEPSPPESPYFRHQFELRYVRDQKILSVTNSGGSASLTSDPGNGVDLFWAYRWHPKWRSRIQAGVRSLSFRAPDGFELTPSAKTLFHFSLAAEWKWNQWFDFFAGLELRTFQYLSAATSSSLSITSTLPFGVFAGGVFHALPRSEKWTADLTVGTQVWLPSSTNGVSVQTSYGLHARATFGYLFQPMGQPLTALLDLGVSYQQMNHGFARQSEVELGFALGVRYTFGASVKRESTPDGVSKPISPPTSSKNSEEKASPEQDLAPLRKNDEESSLNEDPENE